MATSKAAAKKSKAVAATKGAKAAIASTLDPAQLVKIEAPVLPVSAVQVLMTGNDVVLTFTRPHPAAFKANGQPAPVAVSEAVAILTMSPGTAKDLATVLTSTLVSHEEQFGEIHTPFLLQRQAANVDLKKSH